MMNINRPTPRSLRQHRRINQQRQTVQPPTPHHPTHARPQPPGTLSEHTQLATMNPPTHPPLTTTIPKSHHPPHPERITPIQQQRGDLLHIHQRTPLTDHNPGWYAPANPLTPPLRAKRFGPTRPRINNSSLPFPERVAPTPTKGHGPVHPTTNPTYKKPAVRLGDRTRHQPIAWTGAHSNKHPPNRHLLVTNITCCNRTHPGHGTLQCAVCGKLFLESVGTPDKASKENALGPSQHKTGRPPSQAHPFARHKKGENEQ